MKLQTAITRENLRVLMTLFYEKAVADEEIGPFFTDALGDDLSDEEWVEHIELLADFWLAKLLGENTYRGNYIGAHYKIPYIKNESFRKWLDLFSDTADELYVPEIADRFKTMGMDFTEEFIREFYDK